MRKKHFPQSRLLVYLLSGLWFSICSAGDIKQTQNDIVALIKSGRMDSAKSGIDKLIADFPQSPDLPEALCWFAEEYGYADKREDEKNLYQWIIQKFPDNPFAEKAKLGLASAEIRTFIESQDYEQAREAIEKLTADFNGRPDPFGTLRASLPNVLYRLARTYEWSDKYYEKLNKYEEAKNIFRHIVDKYPDSSKFDKARLGIYRMDICSSIASKRFEAAQDEFDKMMIDFSQHPDLPDTLQRIGRRYEWSDRYKDANDLYQQVIANWPDSSYAQKAKFDIRRAQIRFLIVSAAAKAMADKSEDFNEAEIAIDNLILDFNGNPDLPEALYWITQRYGYSGKYEEEKNLYQHIMTNYPDSLYANRAKLDLAGAEALTLVASQDNDANLSAEALAKADIILDKMAADFNSHPYLPDAMLFIVDKYYEKTLGPKARRQDSNSSPKDDSQRDRLYHFTIETMEKYVFDRVSGKDNEAEAYYRAAVSAYGLGDTDKTIDYSEILLQADPNFRYAANMLWLAADGYEKLKDAGKIPAAEADIIIEETYQELMDKYPQNKVADYAALHLGTINYRQGNNVKACAYFGWFLMNASPDSTQDAKRMNAIRRITEGCSGFGRLTTGRRNNGK